MRVALLAGLITIVAASPLTAFSAETSKGVPGVLPSTESVLTEQLTNFVDQEVRRRELALQLAPIKSSSDLATYLHKTPKSASPLNRLTLGAQRRFLNNLTFNEKGLTGYDYSDMVAELSASEIYQILSLFGAQHTASLLKGARVQSKADQAVMELINNSPMMRMPDYNNYWCSSRATCSPSEERICMSAC